MKKRIICLLIAMLMLIPAAVFSANAAAVKIGAITIDNLREPVAGNTPDYEVKVTNGAVDLYQSAHSTENGVIWRKIVNGSEYPMNKTDVFECGKAYSVRIYVKRQTDEDFFADSIIGKIGDGLGNYVTADVRKLSSDPSVAVVMFIFECNKTAISSVAVNGVTEPAPDSRMNFEVNLGQNSNCDLSQDGRLVFWVDEKTGTSYSDNKINDFAQGKVYTIQIYLEPKSGYAFPDNLEKVIATVNGQRAELKYDEKNSLYFIQKRFDTCGSVESIEVNYAAPSVGQLPSFDQVVNYRYTSKGTGTYKTNGISWYDETAQKHLIKGTGQKFESHHVYTVTFELESEEYTVQTAQGNDYKYYEFNGNSKATVNGRSASIELAMSGGAWKWATVKYTFAPLDKCSPVAVSKKDATCTEKGNAAYYACACGKMYGDADGILEITEKDVAISANGHKYTNACDTSCNTCKATRKITHSYKSVTTKATLSKNGKVENKCSVCGYVSKTTTVYYPKTIKLEYTSTIYSGKAKSPKVTVKDSKGNTLKKDTDYTVKYASGRKSTGKYAVTITFKGKYSGTKTLYFNILPSKTSKITITPSTTEIKASWKKVTGASGYKVELLNSKGKVVKSVTTTKTSYTFKKLSKVTTYKVRVTAYKTIDKKAVYSTSSTTVTTSTAPAAATLSKVTAGSKQATLAWKTVSGASGYEVQYSTSSKFKSAKTATVKKGSSKKTTIKKLTKGKKYYFKVRAYKSVDGKKIYGAWSAVKNVKIK